MSMHDSLRRRAAEILALPAREPAQDQGKPVLRRSQHPTERDRAGLLMARAVLARREGIYGNAYTLIDQLLEQIGGAAALDEPSYDELLAAVADPATVE